MNKNYYRKTKIICTIGPATSDYEVLKKLHDAGMNIARLNMSHGDQKTHAEIIRKLRTLNRNTRNPVAILVDTQGPEIRTGNIEKDFTLHMGDEVDIAVGGGDDIETTSTIVVNYGDMVKDLHPGDRISVDNGLINLEVLKKSRFGLKCRVVDGGVMKSRRHINLPGIRVNLPAITSKDENDIRFAIEQEVDFIALSFVRSPTDIEECKRIIARHQGHAQVIAKIEDKFGVENMREIIDASYGVMVARGDLGVEVPLEELPIIQRKIVKVASELGKCSIIATHLMESMIEHPIPTRAEVTDVANAVFEEADCVMLSAETSVGKYPIKAVEMLDKICSRIERSGGIGWCAHRKVKTAREKLARSAVELGDEVHADAIFVFTRRGIMADFVTSFHPRVPPVFAFTNMTTIRRRLTMNRACYPLRIDFSKDPEKTIQNAMKAVLSRKLLPEGARVVIVSDILVRGGTVDAIQIRSVEKEAVE